MVKMNERQRRFADYYIETGNAEESAKRAGYSARGNTTKLLQNTTIKTYIDKRLAELKEKNIADQEEVLRLLTDIARGKATGTALVGIGQGAQNVEQVTPTLSERTRAAELLGKRYALFTDKQEVTQRNIEIKVGDYDDDDNA